MKRIEALREAGAAAPIDLQLARLLADLERSHGEAEGAATVALSAALVSAQRERGHSCIVLEEWAGAAFPADGEAAASAPKLPARKAWTDALERATTVGDGSAPTPLVLDEGRLYLYRYWRAEQRLIENLRARLAVPAQAPQTKPFVKLFRKLFPPSDGDEKWQAVGAVAALRGGLTIITGGPGTGKTSTVACILALLLEQTPAPRVALAAPTGKAAARLMESVQDNAATRKIPKRLRERFPDSSQTLHRLLGYTPWNDRFRCDASRPLAEDVVIVDEASMVDLLMMDALFDGVRPGARVILLGDRDQLASVEAGYVLGDLCRAAGLEERPSPVGEPFAQAVRELAGIELESAADAPPLRDAVVELRKNFRFRERSGIRDAAQAVRRGDAQAAMDVLADKKRQESDVRPHPAAPADVLEPLVPLLEKLLAANTPAQALERHGALRILCAVRAGPWGVEGMNRAVEAWLRGRGRDTSTEYYRGQPLLITANDYSVDLYNGDIGVCWDDQDGFAVHFPGTGGRTRTISPARLPPHETAWAMTVHKSQGSEFDRVALVLPDRESPVLSRELLYTGITRARRYVDVFGPEEVIRRAIARTAVRTSGLAAGLLRGA